VVSSLARRFGDPNIAEEAAAEAFAAARWPADACGWQAQLAHQVRDQPYAPRVPVPVQRRGHARAPVSARPARTLRGPARPARSGGRRRRCCSYSLPALITALDDVTTMLDRCHPRRRASGQRLSQPRHRVSRQP
jgi:hypothetical protein